MAQEAIFHITCLVMPLRHELRSHCKAYFTAQWWILILVTMPATCLGMILAIAFGVSCCSGLFNSSYNGAARQVARKIAPCNISLSLTNILIHFYPRNYFVIITITIFENIFILIPRAPNYFMVSYNVIMEIPNSHNF